MASDDNPFRRALDEREDTEPVGRRELARRVPFDELEKKEVLTKREQLRTVADLKIADPALLRRNPKVADLTVRDLNDLAAQFSGIPTHNPKVAKLTIEDMQDIEGIFLEYKLSAAVGVADLVRGRAPSASVDVSCCCCTPCCCCAAAEVEPIRA